MITVKDILASKPKASNYIEPTALVENALILMNTVNLSYLVVKDNDQFKGIFSERDYTRNVFLKGRTSRDTMVQEVMSADLPIVGLNNSVEECMNLMNAHRTRYLLAFDKGQFAGVVTIHDLLRQVIANREEVFDTSLTSSLLDNDEGGLIY